MRKISSQMPIGLKLKKADLQVNNSKGLKDLDKDVVNKLIPQIYQRLGYIDNTVEEAK